MSTQRYQVGELVDVTIRGARVVATEPETSTVTVHYPLTTSSTLHEVAVMLSPAAVVERRWPADAGEPRVGDIWLGASKRRYAAVETPADYEMDGAPMLLPLVAGGALRMPEDVRAVDGPLTLIWREGWTAADVQAEPEPEKLDERAAKVLGLRELADFVETHPELPIRKYSSGLTLTHYLENDEHAELERIAAVLGVEPDSRTVPPHPGARHRYARKTFSGGIKIEAVICDAYSKPTDVPPSPPEEVAGPVAAGPATAPATGQWWRHRQTGELIRLGTPDADQKGWDYTDLRKPQEPDACWISVRNLLDGFQLLVGHPDGRHFDPTGGEPFYAEDALVPDADGDEGCPAHGVHPHRGARCLDCPTCVGERVADGDTGSVAER